MAFAPLRDFLDRKHVKYTWLNHSPAFTAQQIAQAAHIPGHEMAKTIIMWVDKKLVMVVLPATVKINLENLKKATGADVIKLANEHDFESKFPGCELGAMPPFGNLFHMDVYVDKTLAKDEYIAFNAGTHSELVRLSYVDFVKLVHPHVLQWN